MTNSDGSIKPNLLADVKILDFESTGISIPVNLVQQDQFGNEFVFVLITSENETIVKKQEITVSNEYEQRAFVSDGLTENDVLINSGSRMIKDGDRVTVKQEQE